MQKIRAVIPEHMRIGISGDSCAATGLLACCDSWLTAVGGVLPQAMSAIARPALDADAAATDNAEQLHPLWELIEDFGSLRVSAILAEHLGLFAAPCLPRPLLGLRRGSGC